MKRIYKYTVPLDPGVYTLDSKHNLHVLNAGQQGEGLAIWAEALTNTGGVTTKVRVLFTGMEAPLFDRYITTFTDADGLVYHIYQVA